MWFVYALILGCVAGLRTMMAPAVTSWAAHLGVLHPENTPLAFMGYRYTYIVFTILALGELIGDKLPFTPSRKTPPQFVARLISGSLVGATVGASMHSLLIGLVLGALGAVVGTLVGASVRGRLATAWHRDLPAALLEDIAAIVIACLCIWGLR